MRKFLLALAGLSLLTITGCTTHDQLADGFRNPPESAKPHTWWHWMNGNVTKEGITADLEAMHRVGVGGAQIFNVSERIPQGNAPVMSDEWHKMITHAATEADRVGIELCIHNCAGWSSSGGPWNTPENAMQFVTTSETHVHGGQRFSGKLPQPPTKLDFYRDVAVLAWPVAAEDAANLASYSPKATTNVIGADAQNAIDGNQATLVNIPKPPAGKPAWVTIELARPMLVRTATIALSRSRVDMAGELQSSGDGQSFHIVRKFRIPRTGPRSLSIKFGENPPKARYYRFAFNSIGGASIQLADLDLSSANELDDARAKAGYGVDFLFNQSNDTKAPADAVHTGDLVNLTSKLAPDGTLTWDTPAGEWVVLRFGYTPTGVTNHPAPPEGTGLECDKFSKGALDAHWHGFMDKVLADVGSAKSLNNCLIDSYETGGQNWTPKMIDEFKRLRGYDPTPYLPAIAGKVVESPEISERFLWDLRRTISDLFAENYYGHFAELCHAHGLKASIEPYTGPYESLVCGQPADIPMGEFWTGENGEESVKVASSVGHIYGKNIIGTESFTARPPAHGRWQEDPYTEKALGDAMYCMGINRFIFHRSAMQPWLDKYPGMTMGQWGFHFDRTNTWFEQSRAWIAYLTRCQYLLQQGQFVADCALFCGESCPVESRKPYADVPRGYDHDQINADVILHSTVKNGRIVTPSGMSYAVLVLPEGDHLMTPAVIRKLRDLVNDGAMVVGEKPQRSPSLINYPACDTEVRQIADGLWTGHSSGKGKATADVQLGRLLASANLPPDFEFKTRTGGGDLLYIHRAKDDNDIYFVSNQRRSFTQAECTFRVTGKIPEFWHADTGVIEPAAIYREENGRTIVPIQFDPAGSVFVIFRPGQREHATELAMGFTVQQDTTRPHIFKIQKAVYEAADGSGQKDVTSVVQGLVHDNSLRFEIANETLGGDPFPDHVKRLRITYLVDDERFERNFAEHEGVDLPSLLTGTTPTSEITAEADGTPAVVAFEPVGITFKTNTGRSLHASDSKFPPSQDISADWQITFPPDWGAPASVAAPALISWTQFNDDGVKYFSGTATYHKTVTISQDNFGETRFGGRKLLYLDLGKVMNIAEVRVNDHDCGILWKPPFRVEISKYLHPGQNTLSIAITNNWPNRLIGDERTKAPDVQWDGIHIAAWPQWLKDGKPSPSGRVTFTTWHHWTANMEPLESGLLGPVKLESALRVVAK